MGIGHWAEVAAANRRTSWITSPASGQLPRLHRRRPAPVRRDEFAPGPQGSSFDWVDDFDSWDRCITRGLPASMFPFMYNNGMRIFQSPGLVALQMEMVHEVRLIPTDGSAHMPAAIGQWLGDSRGTWEDRQHAAGGNRAISAPAPAPPISAPPAPRARTIRPVSASAVLVERFHMVEPDAIIYEFTWDDPVVFTAALVRAARMAARR